MLACFVFVKPLCFLTSADNVKFTLTSYFTLKGVQTKLSLAALGESLIKILRRKIRQTVRSLISDILERNLPGFDALMLPLAHVFAELMDHASGLLVSHCIHRS
jgi:hypothetical protein